MQTLRLFKCIVAALMIFGILGTLAPAHSRSGSERSKEDAWNSLPFTAREWARQTLLPYRQIPLKDGGSMDVRSAYDLYLKAGQPEYPDMSTPGLVSKAELEEQMRLSKNQSGKGSL